MRATDEPRAFETLLEHLKQTRGFDFTAYKRPSLMRRIQQRMRAIEITGYQNYLDFLEVHAEEFIYLFNTILINVTSFFRDEESWQYLSEQILPRIVADKRPGDLIRVWVAGCSSGEEAYTVALLLAQKLGDVEYGDRVKIYATDVDEDALNYARLATYD